MSIDSDPELPAAIDDPTGVVVTDADATADDATADTLDDGTPGAASDEHPPQQRWQRLDLVLDWIFDNWPTLIVGFGVSFYFWYFGRLTTEIHNGYGSSAFDIGIFDQGTWLLSRFHNPFVTLTGRNLFADHTSFILILVAPLYWVFPGPTTLLYLQAAALAAAAIPIYLIAKKRLGPVLGMLMALAYLLHPALSASNMENYHPDSFLALFIALALYAAIEDRTGLFIVSIVLCLLVKEDVILIVLPLVVWYAWRRQLRLGTIIGAASLVWTFLCLKLIRTLNHGIDLQSAARIPFGGKVHDVWREMYRKPGDFADYLRSENRPFYLWQMLVPTLFAFVLAPEVGLIAAPMLAWNILSTFGYQHLIAYHYVMGLVPVISVGAIWGISRLTKPRYRQIAVALVFVFSLWTAFLWGPFSWSRGGEPGHWLPSNPTVQQIEEIRKQVPPNVVISAYHSFTPHIAHRRRIYLWPVPWRAVYWGQLKQEGEPLPFTNDIQYLFLPTHLIPEDQPLFDSIKSQFEVVARNEGATLYKRIGT